MTLEGILDDLIELYGDETGRATFTRMAALLDGYRSHSLSRRPGKGTLTERDAVLITYADQVQSTGVTPLRSLAEFCEHYLTGLISGIHILPFFPASSDDGFSVIDYMLVDPNLGSWQDITFAGQKFRLMLDAVINHVSAQSEWFQGFLKGDPKYKDFFIVVEGSPDLSHVVRPRALPLLTRFSVLGEEKWVWTTFSEDQIDLNYHNPEVLLKIVETILFYVSQGAEFIRLDAIAYLWKEAGTSCIHLPQTHRIVQLLCAALALVAPHVFLITETNVSHQENLSYFGDGTNEAQLVYNFALPPLVLHSLQTGEAGKLSQWAGNLALPSKQVTFLNFLASHDGIGLNPARGILTDAEIDALVERTRRHGGLVSSKQNPDGSQSPYELNINYFDALSDPGIHEAVPTMIDRFMTAQAIMLSLVGVPGIYFHSLFGSRGWPEGVEQTGHHRSINRQKLERAALERDLSDPATLRYWISKRYFQLLKARTTSPAFYPYADQTILDCGQKIFAVLRQNPISGDQILCLHNVSDRPQHVRINFKSKFMDSGALVDIITGLLPEQPHREMVNLQPYQSLWLG
jgi:glucosylglycerate phosphorylase